MNHEPLIHEIDKQIAFLQRARRSLENATTLYDQCSCVGAIASVASKLTSIAQSVTDDMWAEWYMTEYGEEEAP